MNEGKKKQRMNESTSKDECGRARFSSKREPGLGIGCRHPLFRRHILVICCYGGRFAVGSHHAYTGGTIPSPWPSGSRLPPLPEASFPGSRPFSSTVSLSSLIISF